MLHNSFIRISDVLTDIARRKSAAGRARQSGDVASSEVPAEVYANVCAQIAASFTEEGYRYAKSGPHLTKKTGDLTFRISFQSSHHNVPGRHICLRVAAVVRSKRLEEWRQAQPRALRCDDWVAGGLIHLLGLRAAFIEWELADADARPAVIADAREVIRRVALPYLAAFTDPSRLIGAVEIGDVPAFQVGDAVEFALCFSDKAHARKILQRFVTERPDLATAIREAEEKIRREGYPRHLSTAYADQVAFLRAAYALAV
jgi:hypothetical protein